MFEVRQVAFDQEAASCGDLSQFSAEEYLAWVVHEASCLPDVMRAPPTPTRQMSEFESGEIKGAVSNQDGERSHLMPALSWERDFILRFSSLTKVRMLHRESFHSVVHLFRIAH